MSEIGIIPGVPGAEGYVELGASSQGRLFRKHLLTIGKQFLHPKTGRPITLGEDAWRQMKANFDSGRIIQTVTFPLADSQNRHTENPLAVAGTCVALDRDGDRVIATLDVKDPDVAERIADGRLPGASAFLSLDAKDPQTGERAGAALLHVCGTLRPALVDLAPYEPVAALCGPAWQTMPDGSELPPTLLMLCQSEADPVTLADPDPQPDYQHEPDWDYGGTMSLSQDDIWRDEIGRLTLMAMSVSDQGTRRRGTRPAYAGLITDADRRAALSAEAEITDEDILAATRELAGQHHVSTDSVHAMAHDCHRRSGVGNSVPERAAVLGQVVIALSRGQLEVSDDQVLALAASGGTGWHAETEVLRLTAEPELEDIFGLAHPSKSGRKVTTRSRAHSDPDEDASTEDPDEAVARYLEMHEGMFGAEARHAGRHNSKSYGPRTPQQREAGQRRAEGGHGGRGGRSIPELHPAYAAGHRQSGSVRALAERDGP